MKVYIDTENQNIKIYNDYQQTWEHFNFMDADLFNLDNDSIEEFLSDRFREDVSVTYI